MDRGLAGRLRAQNSAARVLIPLVERDPEVLGDVEAGRGFVLPRVVGQDPTSGGVVLDLLLHQASIL